MAARDRHLGLVRKATAEFSLRPGQYCARFGIDKELGHVGLTKPFSVGIDYGAYVLWFSCEWTLPRPGQRRASVFAGVLEWAPVNSHLFFSQSPQN